MGDCALHFWVDRLVAVGRSLLDLLVLVGPALGVVPFNLVPWWCLLALGLGVAFLVPCSFEEIQISREEILSRFLDFCISA